jgi:hypothetical protein
MVHFPQAFTYSLPVVLLLALALKGSAEALLQTARVLIIALPLVVLGGILTGIADGVTRFKKVGTPLLSRKLVVGGVYLLSSVLLAWVVHAGGLGVLAWCLLAVAMACSAVLGLIGARLTSSKLPG